MKNLVRSLMLIAVSLPGYAQTPVQQVINAEYAFAKTAGERGMQQAFLLNMSGHSLIEHNGKLVNGMPVFESMHPDTTGKLLWQPEFAAVSAAGDLGYTTGPYKFRIKDQDVAFGDFATIWERQPDGTWKFLIDLGSSHAKPETSFSKGLAIQLLPDGPSASANEDLVQVDLAFNSSIQLKGRSAYAAAFHRQAHILHSGSMPLTGPSKDEIFSSLRSTVNFRPEGSRLSSSNDFGVVYGYCDITGPSGSPTHPETGVYMHVWRKSAASGWQLIHETIKRDQKH